MITARDLRIGNLVLICGKITTVTGVDEYGVNPDFCQGNMRYGYDFETPYDDTLEGISFTEEWLVKFGWVWNEECKSYEKYPNGDARMNLQYRPVNSIYTMFNHVNKALIAERIFYVHSLQNLHFALTNKELI